METAIRARVFLGSSPGTPGSTEVSDSRYLQATHGPGFSLLGVGHLSKGMAERTS